MVFIQVVYVGDKRSTQQVDPADEGLIDFVLLVQLEIFKGAF